MHWSRLVRRNEEGTILPAVFRFVEAGGALYAVNKIVINIVGPALGLEVDQGVKSLKGSFPVMSEGCDPVLEVLLSHRRDEACPGGVSDVTCQRPERLTAFPVHHPIVVFSRPHLDAPEKIALPHPFPEKIRHFVLTSFCTRSRVCTLGLRGSHRACPHFSRDSRPQQEVLRSDHLRQSGIKGSNQALTVIASLTCPAFSGSQRGSRHPFGSNEHEAVSAHNDNAHFQWRHYFIPSRHSGQNWRQVKLRQTDKRTPRHAARQWNPRCKGVELMVQLCLGRQQQRIYLSIFSPPAGGEFPLWLPPFSPR